MVSPMASPRLTSPIDTMAASTTPVTMDISSPKVSSEAKTSRITGKAS